MNPENFRLVVTSGPTREWLDPVRFITNASSGKTGWSLAAAGKRLKFQKVVLISGLSLEQYRRLEGVENINVETTADLCQAVRESLVNRTLLIMAAAPVDFRPLQENPAKIKKSGKSLTIELQPTTDILKDIEPLVRSLESCHTVGFAAETDHILENAGEKLQRKNLDFICANEVFRTTKGFGENQNSWSLLNRKGDCVLLGPAAKEQLAEKLLEHLIQVLP